MQAGRTLGNNAKMHPRLNRCAFFVVGDTKGRAEMDSCHSSDTCFFFQKKVNHEARNTLTIKTCLELAEHNNLQTNILRPRISS
jgi:hypothetical protein